MLCGSLHSRRNPSGAFCPRTTFRFGSRVAQSSKLLTRLPAPVLIVIVVLGLRVQHYSIACCNRWERHCVLIGRDGLDRQDRGKSDPPIGFYQE
jgi:hypothetical protein